MTYPQSPEAPMPSPHRDDFLIGLIEECGEVIQAATKCLRFGFDHTEPGYGNNRIELAKEIGQLEAMCREMLSFVGMTGQLAAELERQTKIEKFVHNFAKYSHNKD